MTTSILILGIGELGLEVVQSLATHPNRDPNIPISVLLRSQNSKNLAILQQWDMTPIFSDIEHASEESLTSLFQPFHTVICCVGMYAPPSTQIKLARAVLAAGVARYFPWQFGIDYDVIGKGSSQNLFDSQLDVRELLRGQQRTKWVIVSTGMFISFLFEPGFGLVDEGRRVVTGIGSWENEISVTAPRDIGRVVAEIVLGHPDIEGVVYCSGDTISMRRLGDVVEEVKGWKVRRVVKSVEDLKEELAEAPDDAMRKYRVVFAEGRGTAWKKDESFNGVHGMEMQTVEDWARVNL